MIKLKQILAWLLVIISNYGYAQLPAPSYVGSAKFSAKGSGATGIPTINFPIPTGTTNKNRIMVITMSGERHNPSGNNFFANNGANDPYDSVDYWDTYVNGNMATMIDGYHSNLITNTSTPTILQNWNALVYTYEIPDNMTGTVPITFTRLKTPQTANDEISFIISVYENVKSFEYIYTPFGIGSAGTISPVASPLGRTAAEIMYMVNGGITQETNLSLSSGWAVDQVNRVDNITTSATSVAANEHDGIAHIVGHRNGITGNPTVTISRTGTGGVFNNLAAFHALIPFASPSISGTVYHDTDGATNINGTVTNAGGTYVNVSNSSNNLVYSALVNVVTGVFTIPSGFVVEGDTYRLELSKNTAPIGAIAPLKELPSGLITVGENRTGISPFVNDGANDGIINLTIGTTNITGLRYGVNSCAAGTAAPAVKNITNTCPAITVNLTTAHTGITPSGSTLVWFTNDAHNGTALAGTQITQAGAGTYYAFYFDSINNCYSPASSAVIATINPCFVCPPDPYAAQQTWWIPYNNSKVRIDFQTGAAVLNNPATGFLGQGTFDGFEGNATVTHPITGELLFVTDGNVIYKGATGVKAIGAAVGGNSSAGEAAGVTPDPQGVLGRDFIIFGNSAGNTPGTLRRAKYNLETNTVSGVTTLLPFNTIYEALEIIPHANGTDYWILLNTTDQKVKSYLYSKATGFNSTPVSSTDVNNLPGVDASTIAIHSFIAWDPRTPGKVLISRHNKVGLANFNPSTGVLGSWDVKVTVTSGTTQDNSYTGYSAALSPNGRYIYYNEYYQPNNTGTLKYYDIQTGLTTALDVSVFGMNGMKIAPDGKLYKQGYISDNLRLLYLNTDANTPPSGPGLLLPFDTGGREIALQLPNNVYWGCTTCQSGTVAPTLANANITSNPATVGDLIALLSASNQPAGTVITIHSATPATDANKLANSTAIVAGTTYYASFYDGLAICYSPTTAVAVGASYCYKPAVLDLGNIYSSKHGITSLGRAATDSDNWPMVRQSAWSVLESKTKGLVVNRVRFNASNQPVADDGTTLVITNPVEGMIVYDKTNNCLKIYTSNNGGSTFQWHCMTTQACPN